MCVSGPDLSRVHLNALENTVIYHIIKTKTKQNQKTQANCIKHFPVAWVSVIRLFFEKTNSLPES